MYILERYMPLGVCFMILVFMLLLINYIGRENLTGAYMGHLHWVLVILYTSLLFLVYRFYGQFGTITSDTVLGFILIWIDLTSIWLYYCCKMEYIVKRRINRLHKIMKEMIDNLQHYTLLVQNAEKYRLTDTEIINLKFKRDELRDDFNELKQIMKERGIKRDAKIYD
ncbi:MAG: hypothetical protein LBT51_06180 [Fusobacteriaceae bacterium]|nr:hypothetical protein [Fusobacteriaceae bacterium]